MPPVLVFSENDHFRPEVLSLRPFANLSDYAIIGQLDASIKAVFQEAGRPIMSNITEIYGVWDWHKPSMMPRAKRRTLLTPLNASNILAITSESSPFSYLEFAVDHRLSLSESLGLSDLEPMNNGFLPLEDSEDIEATQDDLSSGDDGTTEQFDNTDEDQYPPELRGHTKAGCHKELKMKDVLSHGEPNCSLDAQTRIVEEYKRSTKDVETDPTWLAPSLRLLVVSVLSRAVIAIQPPDGYMISSSVETGMKTIISIPKHCTSLPFLIVFIIYILQCHDGGCNILVIRSVTRHQK